MEKREHTLEAAVQSLNKLNTEQQQFNEWQHEMDKSLTSINTMLKESGHDLDMLRKLDDECKSIEVSLYPRQADLKFMKQSLQNYATLADAFTKDLQNYCLRIKSSCEDSNEQLSDLSTLRKTLNENEEHYNALCNKLNTLREALLLVVDSHLIFNNSCAKLDNWLSDMEPKINVELKKSSRLIADLNSNSSAIGIEASVRKLDELLARFEAFKSEVQTEHKSMDEIRKNMNKLTGQLENMSKFTKQIVAAVPNALFARVKALDDKLATHCDHLLNEIKRLHSVKENLDSTSKWLNEMNQVYLSGASMAHLQSSHEDKLEFYDRLKSDLNSRKQILLKNLNESVRYFDKKVGKRKFYLLIFIF